ncbi:unnamed protein product [Rotaria sp. Silwood1]|nr:unnamed protein product [Rotaria sp. Silwood1]CAF3322249.1 unnamed protein product [Rotaria sp. Silwood1]CAF3342475.1 unnamed protein product [Rotaria sp. Silwood1]CAF4772774.1 unnamed protein product [Rotaria sp. Silwood1]CAF4802460.1 unnamed protein product [Rotaria sp. Silwood1]
MNATTTIPITMESEHLFNKYMRLINFILSCTGLLFNLLLVIMLLSIGRRQCATYFLLILMAICDFLYCSIYVSIILTAHQYINIINHQIMCPLSFFLTPFTFTGSTLLLFICLLHLMTNYVRKYDTILGQLGGRLSVVFVLAFIIIRSVLGSTSIELVVLDPDKPQIRFCTIDTNTPIIVATVQKINHIFAEVTDILIYIGWIIILFIYFISLFRCKKFHSNDQTNSLSLIDKPLSYTSLLTNNNNNNNNSVNNGQNMVTMPMESLDMLNVTNQPTVTAIINNKQRHNDISSIVLSISLISVILYLPIMVFKYVTMYRVYRDKALLTEQHMYFLQLFQHTAHLICLSIRFLPYFIFDKRISVFMNHMIGMKCMKIESERTLSRQRKYKLKHKYIWHCQCYRLQQVLEFDNNNDGT